MSSVPIKNCLIPDWRYSISKGKYTFGGFTADMGWILMVARYAYSTDREIVFPKHWGHGNINHTNWNTMFQEPYDTRNCMHISAFDSKNADIRQKVKFKDFYTGRDTFAHQPNTMAQKKLGFRFIEPNNDLKTMRALFRTLFGTLTPSAKQTVENIKTLVNIQDGPYVSMHIRWGDKIGRGAKEDPKESSFIPLSYYVSQIPDHIKTIYVGTDDIRAIDELRKLIKTTQRIKYIDHSSYGFSISRYEPNYEETLRLWADMELMSEAELFIGNFESNVPRIIHLMRTKKSIDIMDVYRKRLQFSCCGTKYNNCFWFCDS